MKALVVLILLSALLPLSAHALNLPSRDVSLEWEEIQGAASYDVEVRQKGSTGKPVVGSSQSTIWNGKLVPGFYEMRVRARDRRKVPGAWSEAIDLTVLLDPPTSDTLKKDMRLAAKETDQTNYNFKWSPVAGAETYELKVTGIDGKEIQKLTTADTNSNIKLPVASQVKWSLMALRSDGLASEVPLTGEMSIWGPSLKKAEPQKPANQYVREINWEASPMATSYAYSLQRLDPKTKKWKSVHSEKQFKDTTLKFSPSWPGGKYRLNLRAQGEMRKSAAIGTVNFDVVEGDRSAAAEFNAMLRQSIVRTTGWYVIASYLMTAMQYEGVNADNGGSVPLRVSLPNNIGGTGRIGGGYLSDRSPWGALGILDMSGFVVDGQNPTFMSFEANAVRRTVVGKTGEFRQQMGLFYKEIPEIIALDLSGIDRIDKIVAAGPHYGVEYWWAMTPKFGLQVNAHAYLSALSIKTPTGNPVTSSLSYQLGVMGSYRLYERTSGLIGYAYREDAQSYKAANDKTNSVKITGHYLNLFLEWAL